MKGTVCESALAAVTNNSRVSMASHNKYLYLAPEYSGWLWICWVWKSSGTVDTERWTRAVPPSMTFCFPACKVGFMCAPCFLIYMLPPTEKQLLTGQA